MSPVPAQLDYHERAKAARARMAGACCQVERVAPPVRIVIDVAARQIELRAARERREAEAAAEREAKITAAFRLAVDSTANPKATAARVMRQAAERHGVSVEQIAGLCRQAKINAARQEAMWTVRERTPLSLTQIGVLFNRDHTSVMWGIRQHEARMAGTSISRVGGRKMSLARQKEAT